MQCTYIIELIYKKVKSYKGYLNFKNVKEKHIKNCHNEKL